MLLYHTVKDNITNYLSKKILKLAHFNLTVLKSNGSFYIRKQFSAIMLGNNVCFCLNDLMTCLSSLQQ